MTTKGQADQDKTAFEAVATEMGDTGEAVARQGERAIFLSFVLPGERVLAKAPIEQGGAWRSEAIEILQPSPERARPICPYFGECGGCRLQHWQEAPYRQWKTGLVIEELRRRGIEPPDQMAIDFIPEGTRRRAEFAAVGLKDGGVRIGFHAPRSERVVDIEKCPLLTARLNGALSTLRAGLRQCLGEAARLDLMVSECEAGVDLAIDAARGSDEKTRAALLRMAGNSDFARVSWRKGDGKAEIIAQFRPLRIEFDGVAVDLPVPSFLQPSREGEAIIRRRIKDWLGKPKQTAELFCGMGSFTFAIAAFGRVLAVDGAQPAIEVLRNAVRAQGLERRIEVAQRDLDKSPLRAGELERFEAVVLDPPRAGARAQAMEIAKCKIARAIYVSCHPKSFARDARILIDGGYELARLQILDQFRWSAHVELVALLRRKGGRRPG